MGDNFVNDAYSLTYERPSSYQFGSQDVLDKYCGKGKFKTLDMCGNIIQDGQDQKLQKGFIFETKVF